MSIKRAHNTIVTNYLTQVRGCAPSVLQAFLHAPAANATWTWNTAKLNNLNGTEKIPTREQYIDT